MDIKVLNEKNNPVLNRREIAFKVIHDEATPSRKESIVERLAATQNSKVGLVYVDSLKTEFGKRETIGYAKIYETEERAKQIERAHIIRKHLCQARRSRSGGELNGSQEGCKKGRRGPKGVSRYYELSGTPSSPKPVCPRCGNGVFLAAHADRQSCGKCGIHRVQEID